jgi:hypothetical protein
MPPPSSELGLDLGVVPVFSKLDESKILLAAETDGVVVDNEAPIPHEEGEADSIARKLMASSICVSSSSTELTNSSTSGVLTNLTNLAPDRDSIHKLSGGVFF